MPRLAARLVLLVAMSMPLYTAPCRAQTLDPVRQSPTVLMQGPADGVAYHALRERTRALIAARKDAEAELLRTVIAFSRVPSHRIYALIGRRTYSATANFITDLERLATPIWVGEASSECCNFHGDASHVVLPFSRIEGEISTVRWNLSQNVFDGRREMSPDVPVQLTAKAYFAGQDPALEAVFRLIQESRGTR